MGLPNPAGERTALPRKPRPVRRGSSIPIPPPREREILRLLADGLPVKDVAEALFISTKTVETHKDSILTRLKAGPLADLVKNAHKNGPSFPQPPPAENSGPKSDPFSRPHGAMHGATLPRIPKRATP